VTFWADRLQVIEIIGSTLSERDFVVAMTCQAAMQCDNPDLTPPQMQLTEIAVSLKNLLSQPLPRPPATPRFNVDRLLPALFFGAFPIVPL
jgi:hypothetical protein